MKKKLCVLLAFLMLGCLFAGCSLFNDDNGGNGDGGGGSNNGAAYYKAAGEYRVGTDIDAGLYLLITDKQNENVLSGAYYEVKASANAQVGSSDFLYNDNFYYRTYVEVTGGQYISFSSCKLYKIDNYPAVDKNAASWHSGQYKVGTDLDVGEYKLTTLKQSDSILDSGYVEITRTPNGRIGTSDFISNDNFQNTKYITLAEGTYVEFSSATLTKV